MTPTSAVPGAADAAAFDANPLLQAWNTPFGLPPYSLLAAHHFEPALRQAMRLHREELAALGAQAAAPDFDNTVAWPAYNWMGVAKSALESVSRYLAKELGPKGIRCNLVAAGPVKTIAAKSIPGFKKFEDVWDDRSPLGWDVTDSSAVAKACVALLSDWFPATTGEMVHVDGGYHAVGA